MTDDGGPAAESRLAELRALFRYYAETGFPAASAPLYAAICAEICDDDEVLALAVETQPGQPAPNLLFAAVHSLLLRGAQHPLAEHYPDLTASPLSAEGAGAKFRDFCLTHREPLSALVRSRLVQTNVLERCGAMLPAIGAAATLLGESQLAVVEIGASAGLNLLWDRFAYSYSDGTAWGNAGSPVQLEIEVRGGTLPAISPELRAASRAGVDLLPVDLADADQLLWQRALIWPERADRVRRLDAAAPLLRELGVTIAAGDAIELLPPLLNVAPADCGLVVLASYVLHQFPEEARRRVLDALREHGRTRPLALVRMDMDLAHAGEFGTLEVTLFAGGRADARIVAEAHPHGNWIAWRAA